MEFHVIPNFRGCKSFFASGMGEYIVKNPLVITQEVDTPVRTVSPVAENTSWDDC